MRIRGPSGLKTGLHCALRVVETSPPSIMHATLRLIRRRLKQRLEERIGTDFKERMGAV